jgi:hypothetical protein
MDNDVENKHPVLEKKTVDKYYLNGEEITESDYNAIAKFVTRFCSICPRYRRFPESRLVETSTGGNSTTFY